MYQPNLPTQKPLPTMYDLPSEEVGDSGLPDQFHYLQAVLLSETCRPPTYPQDRFLTAIDLNLYYDSRHPRRYKRPDWFMAVDVPNSAQQEELRWSYVVWQESVSPFLVVELLSPGTESEDLRQEVRAIDQPPGKWEVYERFLRIPYYVLYDRYQNNFRAFRLEGTAYQEQELPGSQLWFTELDLGLGVWQGPYQNISGLWLRWYDAQGKWVPTEVELTEQERHKTEQERQNAEQERQRASLAEANVMAKDQEIRQKDQTIVEKDQAIVEKDQEIKQQAQEIVEKDQEIKQQAQEITRLLELLKAQQ
jgi:Uma2 family endonuclease